MTENQDIPIKKVVFTEEMLAAAVPNSIIVSGEAPDNPHGLHMTGSGHLLRWVIVKGFNDDWTMYTHKAIYTKDYIADWGDTVFSIDNLRNVLEGVSKELLCKYTR